MLLVAYAPAIVQDLSTPEKAIAALAAAVSQRDAAKLAACLVKSAPPEKLAALFRGVPEGTTLTIEIATATVDKQTDTEATVTVQFKATVTPAPPQPPPLSPKETVTLQKVGADWKIVAPKDGESPAGFVGSIARIALDPEKSAPTAQSAPSDPATVVLSNFKQIALGCLLLCQDYDEVFKFTPATFKKAIQPYIKNTVVFHSPLDKPGVDSVRLNPAMANASLARIKAPAKTVLIFEGEPGKLRFRYSGNRAVIGFVDGHCKLVTQAEAKKLLWKP